MCKVGDVVVLIADGQRMTVDVVDDVNNRLRCVWFDEEERLRKKWFYADEVRRKGDQ